MSYSDMPDIEKIKSIVTVIINLKLNKDHILILSNRDINYSGIALFFAKPSYEAVADYIKDNLESFSIFGISYYAGLITYNSRILYLR